MSYLSFNNSVVADSTADGLMSVGIRLPMPVATMKTAVKREKSFEEILWDTSNKLRYSVKSAEYKHVVFSLIFLKFVSDKFGERRSEHVAEGKEGYPAIRPEVVGATQIAIPSLAVLQLFEDQASPLIAKVGGHRKEAEILSRLRNTLIP